MSGRRLLVTSIGSGVGRAVMDAVRHSDHHYEVTGLSTVPVDVPGATVRDASPTDSGVAFQDAVARAVADHQCELVLAGRDEDAAVLAGMAGRLWSLRAVFPSGPAGLVEATVDKSRTAVLLSPGVRFATTAVGLPAALQLAASTGWPLVLKPRRGCASRGVRLVHTEDDLRCALSPADLVQAYVPLLPTDRRPWDGLLPGGQDGEYSVQVMLGPASGLDGWNATRNTLENGCPMVAEVVRSGGLDDFVASTVRVLAARDGTGPWNLQGRIDARGGLHIFEVNARTTGLTGLRASLGFNEVDMLYDSFVLGRPIENAGMTAGQVLDASTWTSPSRPRYAHG